jgi:acyl-CoA dehydrogenase
MLPPCAWVAELASEALAPNIARFHDWARSWHAPAVANTGILDALLTLPVEPVAHANITEWWRWHCDVTSQWELPIDRALVAALQADRLGYAFSSGFHSALAALVPSLPREHRTAFCATEERGAHPKNIATRLERSDDGWRLNGFKKWSTLGTEASTVLVVATAGQDGEGRNRLRVAHVLTNAPGVQLDAMPPTPFVPEVPHATLTLADVKLSDADILPGDGYQDYLKPFRTVEDTYVQAALLGYLLGIARRSTWPDELLQRIVSSILAARGLTAEDPNSPATHVALAGLLDSTQALVADSASHWASVDDAERERWTRDGQLLGIAGTARAQRRVRAWERLRA